MLPGPTIIKKCSVCFKALKQHTITSGNTCGAIFWSDGKHEAPMLPDQPLLVICPHCHAPLWIDELEELTRFDRYLRSYDWLDEFESGTSTKLESEESILREKFNDAKRFELPTFDDYIAVVGRCADDPVKEKYLRQRAWWAGNDSRRNQEIEVELSEREAANLTAFSKLLDESNSLDLVTKAEVMRELGHFGDAGRLLAQVDDDRLSRAVSIIMTLVAEKDPYVRELDSRKPKPYKAL